MIPLVRIHLVSASLLALVVPVPAERSTVLVSRASDGAPSNDYSGGASLSQDGRVVAFHSAGGNLVAGDTNGLIDVFVHDRVTGLTRRASVSSAGAQSDGESWDPSVSGDGRFVAFWSEGTNLVPNDTNAWQDVFVHEVATGITVRASVSSTGAQANERSGGARISFDGRFVAFDSFASNLVPADGNGSVADVFVRDLLLGTTTLVSLTSGGGTASGWCQGASVSDDGRYVAFTSTASNLVPADVNGHVDVFVRDTLAGTTTLVSRSSAGTQGNGTSDAARISGDGRVVAFRSDADELVPGDRNAASDVFARDLVLGTTERVSVGPAGAECDGGTFGPAVSRNGRHVAFNGGGTNLVPGDTNGQPDVFVHDRATRVTALASRSTSGSLGDDFSAYPSLSGDGEHVGFESPAGNLVDLTLPSSRDVFVHDLYACGPTVAVFCPAATTSSGCVPSITAAGTPSATAGSGFTITATELEGERMGLVFYGVAGPAAAPFGGGSSVMCVQEPLQRTEPMATGGAAGGCAGQLSVDWNQYIATHAAALGVPFAGGETVWAQAWFRDPAAPGGSHLSGALWFDVCR